MASFGASLFITVSSRKFHFDITYSYVPYAAAIAI